MITRIEFAAIDQEVKEAVDNTLAEMRIVNQNEYALFLANGEYKKEYDHQHSTLNPHVIDDRMDSIADSSRFTFLTDFLTTFYSFPAHQQATDDSHQRLHMELMIYAHIWESRPFLKKLYRLAHQSNWERYCWDVKIPPMQKHIFIREDVRQTFQDIGNPLYQVIKNGFHTTIRNAFAHSEYFFDEMNNNRRFIFENRASWEPTSISFDDWSRRFVYSALLSYHVAAVSHQHRVNLINVSGVDLFQIKHPSKKNGFNYVWMRYDQQHNRFNFD